MYLNDTARGNGDYGNGAGDVGIDCASDLNGRRGCIVRRGNERELIRMIDVNQIWVGVRLDDGGRRSFAFGIGRLCVAA
jgi:hypothetical protein